MSIKVKDDTHLIVAVKFVKRKENSEQGVIYFNKNNEEKVLSLLKFRKFLNKMSIIKPSIKRPTMFRTSPLTTVESKNN